MTNQSYRKALIDALKTLNETDHNIFGAALGVLMAEEWKDLDQAFEVGDTYEFHLSQLESSQDANIQPLVTLIKTIRTTIQALQNINGISDNEIDG